MGNQSGDGDRDAALIALVAGRDRVAFEELYRRNAPWLFARLARRCADEQIVADVVQETFLAVWRAAATYRASGPAPGWIWSIASRRLIDAFRRRARHHAEVLEPPDMAVSVSSEDIVLDQLIDARLVAALATLSPQMRAVLQATVIDGLSVRETSTLLGVPENTVKTWSHRARLRLREAMT